ncbi:glycine dehydrogenase [Catenaria anguillulae PL171]|uniref:Glycine cleavage system P protein n=1 Tax=Catenaria anguillulae PL171 TaxID=765915 RepID=A0A1Y2HT14_9FUNG|nr:glycine dehydrogenase [Catenaria anguillulae PL171]
MSSSRRLIRLSRALPAPAHVAAAAVAARPLGRSATTSAARPALGATRRQLNTYAPLDTFERRHNGPTSPSDLDAMLSTVGCASLDDLVTKSVPASIRRHEPLALGPARSETEILGDLRAIANKNKVFKTYIGQGYYGTKVPAVIQRNVMENPGYYTQYSPYQAEQSQGRLESLLNYQTVVADLTGLPVANASLLDEATAAGEAMIMTFAAAKQAKKTFFVDQHVFPQTLAVLKMRAEGFAINVVVGDYKTFDLESVKDDLMGVLVQYPAANGSLEDYKSFAAQVHSYKAQVTCATDLLALTLLTPPGEWGADIAFGSAQRFGVPLGYGGPHAAFFACGDAHKRRMPGRLIGVTRDATGKRAYRLALQTREQHIRREKATSNICTAQALLANMAAMYAVYHGPSGLKDIATQVHQLTGVLAEGLKEIRGVEVVNGTFFDTLRVRVPEGVDALVTLAESRGVNLGVVDGEHVQVSLDETTTAADVAHLISLFAQASRRNQYLASTARALPGTRLHQVAATSAPASSIPSSLVRTSPFLTNPVFNSYHSETEMLRYIKHLESKDLSLTHSMIPLGSCTMKLNATVEMVPVTWPEFGNIHPFAPAHQAQGYAQLIDELEYALAECTGFHSVSLQPNSGAQGEYAGLRVIRAYHASRGEAHRDVCLIPVSAHGTNPASAAMAGLRVVAVACDEKGNLDLADLQAKAEKHKDKLAAIMVTYPSTFGVFEDGIRQVCDIIHANGGQVYLDGANLNAQIGLCRPGDYGADVCHLNLHKTFCIPHGGGGPGVGPIGVAKHLAPYLPAHPHPEYAARCGGEPGKALGPVSAAPYGSASILPISWAYIKLMGADGLKRATQTAILNANYLMKRLEGKYKILYTNKHGLCAHEFILDARPFAHLGIEAVDIAKRLHDYSFHSPTMSWPVANTLMIEPTESEGRRELDRLAEALLAIREEIAKVERGEWPRDNNPLVNAPHPVAVLLADKWDKPYSREVAAFPVQGLRERKFWPTIARVDDAFGDKNLVCTCPSVEEMAE